MKVADTEFLARLQYTSWVAYTQERIDTEEFDELLDLIYKLDRWILALEEKHD